MMTLVLPAMTTLAVSAMMTLAMAMEACLEKGRDSVVSLPPPDPTRHAPAALVRTDVYLCV
jgi:hypothetical protein